MLKTLVKRLVAEARPLYARPNEVMVIPPADSGSLGDQAMLDSAVAAFVRQGRQVSVLHVAPTSTPIALRSPCRYVDNSRRGAAASLSRRLAALRTAAVATLGADVIDGVYSPGLELRRLELMKEAGRAGARLVVLGCSISATPAPAVIAALRAMPELAVRLRDEISLARFENAVGRPGLLVADVAFLLEPAITSQAGRAAEAWIAASRAAGAVVLAVNASGHTLEKTRGEGVTAQAAAVRSWLLHDPLRRALIVPHDTRPAPVGDVELSEQMAERLTEFGDRVRLVRPSFHAWEVKALMGGVDAVLTGRMHLAIAALGMGTPPLCVVYQGKYEGLMRHFRLEGLLMEPAELLEPEAVAGRLARFVAESPGLRRRIAERLPAVKALSVRNFDAPGGDA